MKEDEIIASGLLELYVTGSLSEEEIQKVEMAIGQFPKVQKEIESIEEGLMRFSESAVGEPSSDVWKRVSQTTSQNRPLSAQTTKRNWSSITGWAAAVLFFAGLTYLMVKNAQLKSDLRTIQTQNVVLTDKATQSETKLAEANNLLEIVRSKDYKPVNLPGNLEVAPDAYAMVYFNKEENIAYLDVKGLPNPPKGKVYQVWSLIMDPLTPRSIAVLDTFESSSSKFFKVENVPDPEAFGITLEPEGGSESPTLTQLYTLGMVSP